MQECPSLTVTKTSNMLSCNHTIKSHSKEVQKIVFCNKCEYSKYNNIFLINHKASTHNYDYRTTQNIKGLSQNILDNKNSGYIGGTLLREKKFRSKLIEQNLYRAKKLGLDEESFYLSCLIQDSFLSSKEATSLGASFDKCSLYSAAALFLAAKMREIDIKTPFVSEIPRLEGSYWDSSHLKKAEIVITNHFDWNLNFITCYDILKELIFLGTFCMSDYITYDEQSLQSKYSNSHRSTACTTPFDSPARQAQRENNNELKLSVRNLAKSTTEFNLESQTKNNMDKESCGLYNDLTNELSSNAHFLDKTPGFNKSQVLAPNDFIYYNKNSLATSSTIKEEVNVSNLDIKTRKDISKKIEKRCLQLLRDICIELKVINFRQELLPFAIITIVREEFGIKNYNSDLFKFWKEIYGVDKKLYSDEYNLLLENLKILDKHIDSKRLVSNSPMKSYPSDEKIIKPAKKEELKIAKPVKKEEQKKKALMPTINDISKTIKLG